MGKYFNKFFRKYASFILRLVTSFSLILNLSYPYFIVAAQELVSESSSSESTDVLEGNFEEELTVEENTEDGSQPIQETLDQELEESSDNIISDPIENVIEIIETDVTEDSLNVEETATTSDEEEITVEEDIPIIVDGAQTDVIVAETDSPESTPVEELSSDSEEGDVEQTDEQPVSETTVVEEVLVTPIPEESTLEVLEAEQLTEISSEKICMSIDDSTSVVSSEDDWELDDANKVAITKGNVELGVKYVFPYEENVSVIFTCLPSSEDQRSTLTMQEVDVDVLKLPDEYKTDAPYAYDISTSMEDGTFEYNLTLPKPDDVDAQIISIDKSYDDVVAEGIDESEIIKVGKDKLDQDGDKVEAVGIDHFSVHVPVYALAADYYTEIGETIVSECVEDAYGKNVTCTANDVSVSYVDNLTIADGCSYVGDDATFTARWHVQATADRKYNVGLYFPYEGQSTALNGTCTVSTLPNSPIPPYYDYDYNFCGDIDGATEVPHTITMTVTCLDSDNDNILDLPYCTTWHQSADVCNSAYDAIPGSPSKCNCPAGGLEIPITVPYSAHIEVVKDLIPSADSGTFDLYIDGVDQDYNSGCGGDGNTTNETKVGAGTSTDSGATYIIGENACAGTALSDYSFSISCVDKSSGSFVAGISNSSFLQLDVEKDDNVVCTITNTRKVGSIEVKKDVVPDNSSTNWNISVTGNTNFTDTLTGDDTTGTREVTIGAYSIIETAGANTNLDDYSTSWSCTKDDIAYKNGTGTTISGVEILSSDDNVVCTFTNTEKYASLTLVKYLPNDNGGAAVQTDFNVYIDDVLSSWGQHDLLAGDHAVREDTISGYTASVWGGNCAADGVITLNPGDNKTCTITNDDKAPTITLIKSISNDHSGMAIPDDFDLTVDGNIVLSGITNTYLANYPYIVNETQLTGYSFVSITGDSKCPKSLGDTITLDEGENITCTITNDDQFGKIIITKQTFPNGSTQSFEFNPSWSDTNFYLSDGQQNDSGWLAPGNYSIVEENDPAISGWDLTNAYCSTGQNPTGAAPDQTSDPRAGEFPLGAGDIIYCVFENTQRGSISGMKWNDINGDSVKDAGEPGLEGWSIGLRTDLTSHGSGSLSTLPDGTYVFNNIVPGNYYICEYSWPSTVEEWYQTYPNSGSIYDGYYCHYVTVEPGQNIKNIDFGNFEYGDITVCKYNDYNGNGAYDSAEDMPLENIDIKLYKQGDGWEYIATQETEENGCTIFEGLKKGSYKVEENYDDDDLKGYYSTNGFIYFENIEILSGDNKARMFLNAKLRSISGIKFNDLDGDGVKDMGEPGLEGWKIYSDTNFNNQYDLGEDYELTDVNGYYKFENLPIDVYIIGEFLSPTQVVQGWIQTAPVSSLFTIDTKLAVDTYDIDFGNVQLSDVHGYKWNDQNGNGERDCLRYSEPTDGPTELFVSDLMVCEEWEPLLPNWDIELSKWDGEKYIPIDSMLTDDEDHFGWYWFEELLPGKYQVCETPQEGWLQRFPDTECHEFNMPEDCDGTMQNALVSRQTVSFVETFCEYHFGNQYIIPDLFISKTNDSWPTEEEVGDTIKYTIKVRAEKSDAYDAIVTDLLPKGFDFDEGSWSAESSIPARSDLVVSVTGYTSPGYWNINKIYKDETITLTYNAKITDDVDSGVYPDLALASAQPSDKSEIIYASSEGSGFSDGTDGVVNDFYVGTKVTVITPEKSIVDEIDVEEKEVEEVLGASTYLPATGFSYEIIGILFILMLVGLSFIIVGKKQKNMKKILSLMLFFGLTLLISKPVSAVIGLVLRVEELESFYNEPFEITFVVSDFAGRDMTGECFVEKPDESTYSQFGSDINISSDGGSYKCNVSDSVLDDEGEYNFKIKVTADGGDYVYSDVLTIDFDNDGPEKPKYIEKDKKSSCKFEITVKTEDDDDIDYVEVYRDDDKEIEANSSSRIETLDMGADEKESFIDELSGDDCGETFYYAARAFDEYGNPSKLTVEELEVTKTISEDKEEVIEEAIALSGGASSTTAGETEENQEGAGLEEEESAGGQVLGEQKAEEEGVQGETTSSGGIFSKWWVWLILVLLGFVMYAFVKKNNNNKN